MKLWVGQVENIKISSPSILSMRRFFFIQIVRHFHFAHSAGYFYFNVFCQPLLHMYARKHNCYLLDPYAKVQPLIMSIVYRADALLHTGVRNSTFAFGRTN